MEDVLDSVRRIVSRWCRTITPLTANVNAGDDTLTVLTTRRFKKGDELTIRNDQNKGEISLYIDEVLDSYTIRLVNPVNFSFDLSESPVVEKTFDNQYLQAIYLGEPSNISHFPAITVSAGNKSSEWLTLKSTKETYNIDINIYVQDSTQEDSYRFLLKMVDTVQKGLKHNVYPIVGPYNTYGLIADAMTGDYYIQVSDTSKLWTPGRIIIEDPWSYQELGISEIIDSNTVKLGSPICQDFLVANNAKMILNTRFIYNSWPSQINYGKIFKGSMLKAATINWFAWEEEVQSRNVPGEPTFS